MYRSSSDCGTIIATHEVSVGSKIFNPPVNGIEALILECAERGNIRRVARKHVAKINGPSPVILSKKWRRKR